MPRFEDVFVVRQDKSKPYPVWGIYDKQRRKFTNDYRWDSEERCQALLAAIIQEVRWRREYNPMYAFDAIFRDPCSYDDCQEIEP